MTGPNELIERARELGVKLREQSAQRLLAYLDAVLEENQHINVTAIRDREEAIPRHLLDSLTLVQVWESLNQEHSPGNILDLGTGGGFPAAPLAVAWPASRVVAIDGTGKKIALVQRCLQQAEILNVEPIQSRGADLPKTHPEMRQHFDLAVARAVGAADKLLRELTPLVASGGTILLMKGAEIPREKLEAAQTTAEKLNLVIHPKKLIEVSGQDPRSVLVFQRR